MPPLFPSVKPLQSVQFFQTINFNLLHPLKQLGVVPFLFRILIGLDSECFLPLQHMTTHRMHAQVRVAS